MCGLALSTPAERRKRLVSIKTGTRWRIDWSKLRCDREVVMAG
jgi:hypothetical protein